MIATGQASAAVPHTNPLPVPTTPRPITARAHRRGLDWTRHTAPPVDPDAIARLQRQGRVTVTEAVVDQRPVKVVKKAKPKKPPKPRTYAPGWTRPDYIDQAIADYHSGLTVRAVAAKHGLKYSALRYQFEQAGLQFRSQTKVPLDKLLEHREQGMPILTMAQMYGIRPDSIYKRLRRAGHTFEDGTVGIKKILADHGATNQDVRDWAARTGRTVPRYGVPSRSMVDAYLRERAS